MIEREKAAEAITADMACEEALSRILEDCAIEIDRHLAVFLETEDESGPHKARVALRRLTTALDAFSPVLRRTGVRALRAEAKAVFRALGEVRDADVFLAGQGDPGARLQSQTAELRRNTRDALRARKAVALAPTVTRGLTEGALLRTSPRGLAARAAPVGELAGAALDSAWAAGVAMGDDLSALSVEALHDFRKDMKTLRYLAEFFAPLWPGEAWPAFRTALQDLQDDLGKLNDLANARARGAAVREDAGETALARSAHAWRKVQECGPFWRATVAA